MTTSTNTPQYGRDHQLDLYEFAADLWQQKWLVMGITALFTLVAIAYALLATPVYQSTASIIPPRAADIAPINLGRDRVQLNQITVEEAYSIFTRNLTSQSTRRWFYEEHFRPYLREEGISGTRDSLIELMGDVLIVRSSGGPDNPDSYIVEVNLSDPELAADFANKFVAEVSMRSLSDLAMYTRAQLTNKRAALEEHIQALRISASDHRADRTAKLQEALAIAQAIGLEDPEVSGGRTQVSIGGLPSETDSGQMLFLNGTKAISSELALLKSRENNDPFIGELRGLQQQISMLDLVDPLPELVRLFTLDSAPDVPENPVKPNKVMIVAIGLALGAILSVVIAIIRVGVRRRDSNNGGSALGS